MKSLDSHPKINDIFIAGGFNREIYFINISKENTKNYNEFISKIENAFIKNVLFLKNL